MPGMEGQEKEPFVVGENELGHYVRERLVPMSDVTKFHFCLFGFHQNRTSRFGYERQT